MRAVVHRIDIGLGKSNHLGVSRTFGLRAVPASNEFIDGGGYHIGVEPYVLPNL